MNTEISKEGALKPRTDREILMEINPMIIDCHRGIQNLLKGTSIDCPELLTQNKERYYNK